MRAPSDGVVSWPVTAILAGSLAFSVASAFGIPNAISVTPEPGLAADAFAAAHLVLIFTVFFGFGVFAWALYRRSRSPNKEREFIEELQEDEELRMKDDEKKKLGAGPESEELLEPWEKSGDWWKKE